MLSGLSQRLLPALQLTRMALVFTAVSDSLCTLLLATQRAHPGESIWPHLRWQDVSLVVLISVGLYGFGMSLNDIIDRRRDRQLAAHRPLPSGRLGVVAAHAICAALALTAVVASAVYSNARYTSLVLTLWTMFLIIFYDVAGKYLVFPGLLTLGLIRFFHAVIPAPHLPLLWQPLLLLNHVAILSAVAYWWEEKRPPLTRLHWWAVFGGLLLINAVAIYGVWWRSRFGYYHGSLWLRPGLALPLIAAAGFVLVGWRIRKTAPNSRQAGQTLMLAGLLWLILYDGLFVAAYVGPTFWSGVPYAVGLLMLLPLSWLMVQLMRWWSQIVLMSQPPNFKRLRSGADPGGRN